MAADLIDVSSLRTLLDEGQPVTVLDVRPAAQRAEWAIPGSLHVDAYDALWDGDPTALADVALPAGVPVVTVCAMGRTSLLAAERLRERGLEARSLVGGMRAWSLAWNAAEVDLPAARARIVQVRRTGKGCLSYIVGCDGVAAVVDPSVSPEVYRDLAKARGWRITEVLETHVHADHLSRARLLADLCGATLRVPEQDRVKFPFTPVRDGTVIPLGAARIVAMRTPGHTLESTCYLVDDCALLSGDTLFPGSVGRPDLEGGTEGAKLRAEALFASIERLRALPPETLVLAAHDGRPIAFDRHPIGARLGEILARVPLLAEPAESFVASVLARIPPTPPNHAKIIECNVSGVFPEADPAELEAGANRCAVA